MTRRTVSIALGLAALIGLAQPASLYAKYAKNPRETPVVTAVRRAAPAVVNVCCEQIIETAPFGGDPFFEGFFRDFFEPHLRRKITLTNLGSGIIIDGRRGYIITNEHVVRGASGIKIVLGDNRTLEATVVGADDDVDLAVLKVDAKGTLPEIPYGNAEDLLIGETAIAIGNPFGFSHTVTTGVISAVHRSIKAADKVYSDFIQTDASINPGNSGGPLLNIDGQLIGVNTAIYAKAQGIGFAIPVNKVRRIAQALISYGAVLPAWLGMEVGEIAGPGATVTYVISGGPAATAGVRFRDVVVSIERETIRSAAHFRQFLAGRSQGDRMTLGLKRGGKGIRVAVTAAPFPLKEAEAWAWRKLGLGVVELSAQTIKSMRLGSARGALINSIRGGSPAARAGLVAGDLIKRIGDDRVGSVAEFRKAVAANTSQEQISVLIQRGQFEGFVDLSP
ncbi:MAG: trypsin-like peptidase domain-containing protein [Pseudomonadota bacterium]